MTKLIKQKNINLFKSYTNTKIGKVNNLKYKILYRETLYLRFHCIIF